MSFKASGPRTRPDRVRPPPAEPQRASSPTNVSVPDSRRSSASSSQPAEFHDARFPPDEESTMIAQSNELKSAANTQFAAQDYSSAISTYDKALAELPNYLDFELAVLHSNIAACHLRLEEWKDAIGAAERGLEGLERELPLPKAKQKKGFASDEAESQGKGKDTDADEKVIELDPANSDAANATLLAQLALSDDRKAAIHRIRTKLLLRRARAKSSLLPASWSNLAGALEDYSLLATPEYMATLPGSDQRTVRRAMLELPAQVNAAKEKEVGDMMGKLKELGNGLLKPFGLSTDMFKMVQDPKTGGYSMNFEQGGGEEKK